MKYYRSKKIYDKYVKKSTVNLDSDTEVIGRLLAIIENILDQEGLAQVMEEDMPDFIFLYNTYDVKHVKDYTVL